MAKHLVWSKPSDNYVVIRLAVEDLTGETRNVRCNVEDCRRDFATPGTLVCHWSKAHFIPRDGVTLHFHCPDPECPYHDDKAGKHFVSMKHLKQHYMLLHAKKTFKCDKCDQRFSLERFLTAHKISCGVIFECSECKQTYPSRPALLTHCGRNKHPIPEKYRSQKAKEAMKKKEDVPPSKPLPSTIVINVLQVANQIKPNKAQDNSKTCRPLLPKPTLIKYLQPPTMNITTFNNTQITTPVNTQGTSVGVGTGATQTNAQYKSSLNMSVGSQIGAPRLQTKAIAETQTSGEYILRKAMKSAAVPISHVHKGSQVSPRAKARASKRKGTEGTPGRKSKKKRHASMQSDPTQTAQNNFTDCYQNTPRGIASAITAYGEKSSTSTSTSMDEDLFELGCYNLSLMESADIETQTMSLIQDFENCLASTISTQTLDSFLLNSTNDRRDTELQTVETQTLLRPELVDSLIQTDVNPMMNIEGGNYAVSNYTSMPVANNQGETLNSIQMVDDETSCSVDLDEILQSMGTQTMDFDTDNILDQNVSQVNMETQTVDLLEQFLHNMETQTMTDSQPSTNSQVEPNDSDYQASCGTSVTLDLEASSASTQTKLRMSGQPNTQSTNMETQTFMQDFGDIFDNTLSSYTQTIEASLVTSLAETETQTY